jgi:purine-cytosine permease-like protein
MAKAGIGLMGIVAWIVGILVSLAVGSGMIQEILTIPGIPAVVTVVAGWIVVVGAIVSIVMAIFGK